MSKEFPPRQPALVKSSGCEGHFPVIQSLEAGETLLPPGLGKQPLERSMWVVMSKDKPEGFLLGRNGHGPHLLQPSEHLLVSGPDKWVAVPGSGFSCVWLQQLADCDDSIRVP